MFKKFFFLFVIFLFSCQKNKVEKHSSVHIENYKVHLNNGYFIVDLSTGKMEDTKGRLLGDLRLEAEDVKFIEKMFFENSIYEITSDVQVFDNRKIHAFKNEDLLLIEKDNALISIIYIDKDYALKSKINKEDVGIVSFYKSIQKILKKYKNYDHQLHLKTENDDSVNL